jgi:hypothetical protein
MTETKEELLPCAHCGTAGGRRGRMNETCKDCTNREGINRTRLIGENRNSLTERSGFYD